jgi:23S rRNA (uracil1939-C5)-methyltransferase
MSQKITTHQRVLVEKLVHGGQGLVTLPDGKKAFVWNALPNELVDIELTKNHKDFSEGFVTQVLSQHPNRVDFLDRTDIRLSVSPWSIMDFDTEIQQKSEILSETFARESVIVPQFVPMKSSGHITAYRNKVEFSFWGDDQGLSFAHYVRASHQKVKLTYPYNPLIRSEIAEKAREVLEELQSRGVRASDIKSLILRSSESDDSREGKVVAALFVKSQEFAEMAIDNLAVVYSNPKSPASVVTKVIYTNGDITLADTIMGKNITYDVFSFFQVHVPVFIQALNAMKEQITSETVVDFYSGVGTIGIPLNAHILVESDAANIAMAKQNVKGTATKVVHATSEAALEYITNDATLIVDPPRAGLHRDVVERIAEVRPRQIIYLSCNPSTQARDVKLLQKQYKITYAQGFNFFPRTPHIESLIVLELK